MHTAEPQSQYINGFLASAPPPEHFPDDDSNNNPHATPAPVAQPSVHQSQSKPSPSPWPTTTPSYPYTTSVPTMYPTPIVTQPVAAAPSPYHAPSQSNLQLVPTQVIAPIPTTTSTTTTATNPTNQYQMYLPAVGYFKDLGISVQAVPAANITYGQSSFDRLIALKSKVNELQKRRSQYHAKLGGAAVTGLVTAPFTFGASLVASGASNLHQRNRIKQIINVIIDTINQINQLRASFSNQHGWQEIETTLRINHSVFKGDIHRSLLKGDL